MSAHEQRLAAWLEKITIEIGPRRQSCDSVALRYSVDATDVRANIERARAVWAEAACDHLATSNPLVVTALLEERLDEARFCATVSRMYSHALAIVDDIISEREAQS